jgi:formylglycine-generating enzyme required for sulfatase activity
MPDHDTKTREQAKAVRLPVDVAQQLRAGSGPNAQFAAAELAATAALEWRECADTTRAECARRIVALLSDDAGLNNLRPVVRARAGDRLSQLGDLRFDPKRFWLPADEMLGFVRIAADPKFRIGTCQADGQRVAKSIGGKVPDREISEALTPTPEFFIARYPVTVAQFRTFVDATGFHIGNKDALSDRENRPVRYVSWHEAIAYCDWLNDVLAKLPLLEDSEAAGLVRQHQWRVALPGELEWEKAARGGLRDMVFPWGNDADPARANYDDSKIGDTSAVGCFSPNDFGLYDMIGNLFEWTRSLWGTQWWWVFCLSRIRSALFNLRKSFADNAERSSSGKTRAQISSSSLSSEASSPQPVLCFLFPRIRNVNADHRTPSRRAWWKTDN